MVHETKTNRAGCRLKEIERDNLGHGETLRYSVKSLTYAQRCGLGQTKGANGHTSCCNPHSFFVIYLSCVNFSKLFISLKQEQSSGGGVIATVFDAQISIDY